MPAPEMASIKTVLNTSSIPQVSFPSNQSRRPTAAGVSSGGTQSGAVAAGCAGDGAATAAAGAAGRPSAAPGWRRPFCGRPRSYSLSKGGWMSPTSADPPYTSVLCVSAAAREGIFPVLLPPGSQRCEDRVLPRATCRLPLQLSSRLAASDKDVAASSVTCRSSFPQEHVILTEDALATTPESRTLRQTLGTSSEWFRKPSITAYSWALSVDSHDDPFISGLFDKKMAILRRNCSHLFGRRAH